MKTKKRLSVVLSSPHDQLSHQTLILVTDETRRNSIFETQHKLFWILDGVRMEVLEHIPAISDMIIARLLSSEKCDTVFSFTSLTINGHWVVASSSSRCCNSFLSPSSNVCILQLVLSSFFRATSWEMVHGEKANCISDFCEWIAYTLAAAGQQPLNGIETKKHSWICLRREAEKHLKFWESFTDLQMSQPKKERMLSI